MHLDRTTVHAALITDLLIKPLISGLSLDQRDHGVDGTVMITTGHMNSNAKGETFTVFCSSSIHHDTKTMSARHGVGST